MGWLSRRSIRLKAPISAALIVLAVGASLSAAAFVVLKRTLHAHAGDRLTAIVGQLSENYRTTVAAGRVRSAATADRPDILRYLTQPTAEHLAAARKALPYGSPQPELDVESDLRTRAGRLLVSSRDAESAPPALDAKGWTALADIADEANDGVAIGRLITDRDAVLYPTVVRVPRHPDAYLVHWRRLSNTSQARAQIANLLGSEAAFFVGNTDGTSWSELGRPAPAAAVAPALGRAYEFDRPGRGRVVAVRSLLTGTPWAFTVEFPVAVVEAPARAFLWTMSWIAALGIGLGMLVAWWMSYRVTEPLEALTAAADAIAAGDMTRRADLRREDEFGRLGAAFNAMAAEVSAARGELEAAVAARTDELRDAHESLARREKLALIGQLVSGVGHEIRNPLGVMSNAVYLLETVQPNAPAEVQQYLGILRRQIQLTTKIVNDLLDWSRATPANRQPVDVRALVEERFHHLRPGNSKLEADVPANLPLVAVDPVHAGQVLDNLLTNALQAIGGQAGLVSVRARVTGDGFVRLEVSDTGEGIAAEHFGKIFEPLFTTKPRGIGLGLALSKTLAQSNGGDLALISGPNQSATFAFTLPVAGMTQ